MKHNILIGTLSALTITAVIASSVVPAAARGMGGDNGSGPRAIPFEELDKDADGKLTLEEFRAPMIARLAEIDTDGDGTLSEEELQAARENGRGEGNGQKRMMGKMHGKQGDHGKMHGRKGGFDGPRGMMSEEQRQERAKMMIERKDTNGDGVLSVEELAAAPDGSRIFARIDADDDGAISEEEFDAAQSKFQKMRNKARKQY